VAQTAARLFAGIASAFPAEAQQHLEWAARLHEIGISIAHSGYHRHSAYILANADMPGFSRRDQERLALLVRAHRGSLAKATPLVTEAQDWPLIAVLRLAVLFHRSRNDEPLPSLSLAWQDKRGQLQVDPRWLADNPLTAMLLEKEQAEWRSLGLQLNCDALGRLPQSPDGV